ncbi:MAG: type III polyketide synthase [Acetobacteraceae bacterium]
MDDAVRLPRMTHAWINRVGTAVPAHDVHAEFVAFGRTLLADERSRVLFDRMAGMADIAHRYAIFAPGPLPRTKALDAEGFYRRGMFPSTAQRMARFHAPALDLAQNAVDDLDLGPGERARITHLIVASCTGFSAPGLDFRLMRAAGLADTVERTMIGFMGCFAAVNALRLARHIVRSEPDARVLVVNVELCSLHMQEQWELTKLLSFLLFGDGASAALVTADPEGLALGAFHTEVVAGTEELITWDIGDYGFEMHLSGQVPGQIRRFARDEGAALLRRLGVHDTTHWAVHAGGRTILDAVHDGLGLGPEALRHSRGVLRDFGNMSSATLMFVLARILAGRHAPGPGVGMAFGPGLTVESFAFHVA